MEAFSAVLPDLQQLASRQLWEYLEAEAKKYQTTPMTVFGCLLGLVATLSAGNVYLQPLGENRKNLRYNSALQLLLIDVPSSGQTSQFTNICGDAISHVEKQRNVQLTSSLSDIKKQIRGTPLTKYKTTLVLNEANGGLLELVRTSTAELVLQTIRRSWDARDFELLFGYQKLCIDLREPCASLVATANPDTCSRFLKKLSKPLNYYGSELKYLLLPSSSAVQSSSRAIDSMNPDAITTNLPTLALRFYDYINMHGPLTFVLDDEAREYFFQLDHDLIDAIRARRVLALVNVHAFSNNPEIETKKTEHHALKNALMIHLLEFLLFPTRDDISKQLPEPQMAIGTILARASAAWCYQLTRVADRVQARVQVQPAVRALPLTATKQILLSPGQFVFYRLYSLTYKASVLTEQQFKTTIEDLARRGLGQIKSLEISTGGRLDIVQCFYKLPAFMWLTDGDVAQVSQEKYAEAYESPSGQRMTTKKAEEIAHVVEHCSRHNPYGKSRNTTR
ncbi:uncharacterized protein LOC129583780 isoform X1 [Paramacrobiotus metropolitanus]|uniref:uncharacterized protein LOC129583780 isoform X1 n=1 Tax=Paramacrobiotus metropolitanus TaxID=2943436 RepID=UPI00244570F5|nr:uncharacterized protein LOC129583780 isoform X1 [Paramacrobiotus metropolitanus]XP_055331719.1 uncharacterized protein LOC129583780 isoform X1 [Paramacrobiotus metropolitanus]